MQFIQSVSNASVKMLTGETVAAAVDRISATATTATLSFSGSGVTSTSTTGGKTNAHIVFADGSTNVSYEPLNGATVQAAIMLRNGEFSLLVPVGTSTTSFTVDSRYVK